MQFTFSLHSSTIPRLFNFFYCSLLLFTLIQSLLYALYSSLFYNRLITNALPSLNTIHFFSSFFYNSQTFQSFIVHFCYSLYYNRCFMRSTLHSFTIALLLMHFPVKLQFSHHSSQSSPGAGCSLTGPFDFT